MQQSIVAAATPPDMFDHLDGEPEEGLLRRRRVAPNTAKVNQMWVERLISRHKFPEKPAATVVDEALDKELVKLFLASVAAAYAGHPYYGTSWWYTLTNETLRPSYASLRGYLKLRRSTIHDPIT